MRVKIERMDNAEAAAIRKSNRRDWSVVRTSLAEQSVTEPIVSPEQGLGMMWQLALDAWAMTGRPLPDYSRAQTPIRRFIRSE